MPKLLTSLIIMFTLILPQTLLAIGWEFGYGKSVPKVWFEDQLYKFHGEEINIKPKFVEETENGNNYQARLLLSFVGIDYQFSNFIYNVLLPAGTVSDSEVRGFSRVRSERYGLSVHITGEVAGVFLGTGQSYNMETIEIDDGILEHKSVSNYLQYGLRLIFDSVAIGYTHLRLPFGSHYMKTNNVQLIFLF